MKIIITCAVVSCLLLEAQGGIAPDRAKRQVLQPPYNSLEGRYTQQMQASRLPPQPLPPTQFQTQRYPPQRFPSQQFPTQQFQTQQFPSQQFPTQQFPTNGNRVNPGGSQYYHDGSQHVGVIDVDAPPNTYSGGVPQYHNDGSRHVGVIDVDGPARGNYPYNTGLNPAVNQGFNRGANPNIQLPGNYYGTFYPGFTYPG